MKPKRGRDGHLSITQRLIRCPKMDYKNKKNKPRTLFTGAAAMMSARKGKKSGRAANTTADKGA